MNMKSLSNDLARYFLYFAFSFMAVGLASCSSDDDVRPPVTTPDPTGSITAGDHTLSGNRIVVESVTVGQDSWLVARRAGSETEPGIVSEAVFLEQGTHTNVELPLLNTANLSGDDDFVLMLHVDDQTLGTRGTFDYDGTSGIDNPIRTAAGANVSQTINVTGPSLSAADNQMVTEDNEVTFENVHVGRDGWIVLYGQNEDGTMNEEDVIGSAFVEAGSYEDYLVAFNEGYVHQPGSTVFPRLHLDDPADGVFSYTIGGTEDLPETYGWDATTGTGMHVQNTSTTNTTGGFTLQ